jgi:DNA topoisomerase III
MTCVLGHLTQLEFGPEYKDWRFPPPERLFDAPVSTVVSEVRHDTDEVSSHGILI